jgi:hypothetical protein
LVYPVLLLLAVVTKAFLYATPVGENFGLVSLLAGINHETLEVLSGAALSGDVKKPLPVSIVVS